MHLQGGEVGQVQPLPHHGRHHQLRCGVPLLAGPGVHGREGPAVGDPGAEGGVPGLSPADGVREEVEGCLDLGLRPSHFLRKYLRGSVFFW